MADVGGLSCHKCGVTHAVYHTCWTGLHDWVPFGLVYPATLANESFVHDPKH